jgi:membrane associated rhomboid family serine protease
MDLSYRTRMRLFVPLGGVAGAVVGSLLGITFLPGVASFVAMAGAVVGVLAVGVYYAVREAAEREREREREEEQMGEGGEPPRGGKRE